MNSVGIGICVTVFGVGVGTGLAWLLVRTNIRFKWGKGMNKTIEQPRQVGVLMGGVSSERDISIKSGKAVAQALDRCGCGVVSLDIDDDREERILSQLHDADIDVAFIALFIPAACG